MLHNVLQRDILPRVEKPSRYLGTEVNSVHKAPGEYDLRLALCFPDLYDIGLGNLGLHILYAILNAQPGVWAERVYAPAKDLEGMLRARGLPLFALESKEPLGRFDGIGFTLQTELSFTNILNIIDLSGLPLRVRDRRESDPLTFAGGPAVFNPEPLVPFMDFFVIGDGEEVVVEIAEAMRRCRGRRARLEALAGIEGVYVPELTPVREVDGQIIPQGVVRKRLTRSLDGATFPVNTIVPFTEQVHDRVSLEVLRGCTQGCRFCQAGMTTRPVRERTIDNLEQLMQRTLDATGHEEVSLVSLSTCDYSRVRQMVDRMVGVARQQHVSVSLPSLRLDSFSVELADMVADTRRTGLTFAPEAASPRLRSVINKWIPDEDLIEMSSEAFARGWDHVKLYFMIGLPTERDEDVLAIADLCERVVRAGRKHNRRASVHTGVSTFVPKPLTPFQWAEQISPAETMRRQRILSDRFHRNPSIKFGRHNPFETFLEGLVSRADRRAGDLLEAAFRKGARFDAWSEHLDQAAWLEAIQDTGYDIQYALRERRLDEALPWDNLDICVPKTWFVDDWNRATELKWAPDCRRAKCHKCGVIDVHRPVCAHMLRDNIAGHKEEKSWTRPPAPAWVEPQARQRLRLRIGRLGQARFLSHLESMNAWIRAIRRAKLPISYSQGFHTHPRVNFSAAVPVGEESVGDWMEITLTQAVPPAEVAARLAAVLPEGLSVLGCEEAPLRGAAVMGLVRGLVYTLHPPEDRPVGAEAAAALQARLAGLMAQERIVISRRKGDEVRQVDIRPFLQVLAWEAPEGGAGAIRLEASVDGGKTARARDVAELLGLADPEGAAGEWRILKRDTLLAEEPERGAGRGSAGADAGADAVGAEVAEASP